MSADESPPPTSCYKDKQALIYLILFSGASASLLLVNKIIMHSAPLPSFVATLQFVATSVTALLVMVQGWAPADKFVWHRAKPCIIYVGMFVTTIYCNFKALEVSNVETLIVARSCVPCIVSVLEFACLGRQLPSLKSWLAMIVMGAAAVGYVLCDKQFEAEGISAYFWVAMYFVVISLEMAYGKYIVGPHLGFASMWGPTLYNNTLSIPPMITIGLLSGEHNELCGVEWSVGLVMLVLVSCVIGVAISFLGFKARSLVSATCFTVLGVANKMLTVIANVLIWDLHATALGIFFLALCLLGAAAYQQPPMRQQQKALLRTEGELVPAPDMQVMEALDVESQEHEVKGGRTANLEAHEGMSANKGHGGTDPQEKA